MPSLNFIFRDLDMTAKAIIFIKNTKLENIPRAQKGDDYLPPVPSMERLNKICLIFSIINKFRHGEQ
jgi:hypothetical protein